MHKFTWAQGHTMCGTKHRCNTEVFREMWDRLCDACPERVAY